MSKKLLWALILLGLSVIILLVNAGGVRVAVDLIVTEIKAVRSMVYLAFLSMGIVIGILLK